MKVKSNLFAKDHRVIKDSYRDGWDRIFNKDKKLAEKDCTCDNKEQDSR